jgi:DNA-binding LytR/AlgR family response regulator
MKLVKQAFSELTFSEPVEPRIISYGMRLQAAIEASGRIILPMVGGYQCCMPDDILYLKAESNYTEIHYLDGSKKLLSKTLKVLEDVLPAHRFFRVHKSYIVNAAHITDIILSTQERAVKLVGGQMLPVSRDKKDMITLKLKA